ncbi:SDR family NAD(P)-dependent oxidoreductase [Nocardioides sp. LS1]|uniref:SDR family NAD(P)-dependent oxidoreductase n=1 Tax=Nocardioides sp. LS1 TaxID=1027620 RepID=UPI000F61DA3F|nr:SDR family NAD(P)-dependent oxidoreductase [Nocardioides sp. LS1]GCD91184.1 3-(cis-5,6-dihydroxycyclohexa-1, 3-dien-1-yl)propanoate dehydrogenase [Nocardioides sp. LS1]
MTGRLEGQSVLVVGGGSGIGRAATTAMHREGASLVVLERSADHARALTEDFGHERLIVLTGDGTASTELERAVSVAVEATGRLDHLTCCVGVFDHYADLTTLNADQLDKAADEVWRVNVLGTLHAVRAAVPDLRASRGSITLTLSESAFHPVGGGVLYGTSKWALRGAVHHLSTQLAPEIRVNAVAPGGTSATKFSGLQSLGTAQQTVAESVDRDARIASGTLLKKTPSPASHAGAYVFLADRDAADVITGQVINTDGGRALT